MDGKDQMHFFARFGKRYLQGGLLVQEIRLVLEAPVVPGIQSEAENRVKECIRFTVTCKSWLVVSQRNATEMHVLPSVQSS